MGERLDRIREAMTGGPRYTPAVGPHASTRDQEKNARRRAREIDLGAGRRRRHRESVAKGKTTFAFEEKPGLFRRRRS
ncbi:hypothetical protein [Streptomyces canus]|uniref:hypothetical protein n=1 Tax=Streptomyces canus TaxID=58343 RepID=UPI002782F26F|nr:hypothetical protein [Streptomyces canus]MDQ0762049.1 hypothetical protein [Streptomyces canus]